MFTRWYSGMIICSDVQRLIVFCDLFIGTTIRVYYYLKTFKSGKNAAIEKKWRSDIFVDFGVISMIVISVLYIFFPMLVSRANAVVSNLFFILGILCLILHIILMYLSHRALGDYWADHVKIYHSHALITDGIYGYSRHPMYLASILWITGTLLVSQNLLFLIASPLFIGVFLRIKKEEKVMEEYFGDKYREYRKKTRMLF